MIFFYSNENYYSCLTFVAKINLNKYYSIMSLLVKLAMHIGYIFSCVINILWEHSSIKLILI